MSQFWHYRLSRSRKQKKLGARYRIGKDEEDGNVSNEVEEEKISYRGHSRRRRIGQKWSIKFPTIRGKQRRQ